MPTTRHCAMRYLLMQGYHCPLPASLSAKCVKCAKCAECAKCAKCAQLARTLLAILPAIFLSPTPILVPPSPSLCLCLILLQQSRTYSTLCCPAIPLLFNSCMKAIAAVTKLPKVSPDFSPIVLFCGRDIWSSGAPM